MKKQIFQSITYWVLLPMLIGGIYLGIPICVQHYIYKKEAHEIEASSKCANQYQKLSKSIRLLEKAELRFLANADEKWLPACQENLKQVNADLGNFTCLGSIEKTDSSNIKRLCNGIDKKIVLSKTFISEKPASSKLVRNQLSLMWDANILTDSLQNIISNLESEQNAYIQHSFPIKDLRLNWGWNLLFVAIFSILCFPLYTHILDIRRKRSGLNTDRNGVNQEAFNISDGKNGILFSENPIPMWVISIPEKRFLDVNTAALVHYGYSREEFFGMSIYDIRPFKEVEKLKNKDFNAENCLYYTAGIWMHQKKDGSLIKVNITVHNLMFKGKEARLILANDVSHKIKMEAALNTSLEDVGDLAMHLEKVRESERTHISREIHDELGQQLTVLKMNISWLHKNTANAAENMRAKTGETLQLIDCTIETVRRIATDLRPSILDDLGLMATLEWQTENFERNANITCKFSSREEEIQVSPEIATGIFRVYQECLTNVLRHSEASNVLCDLQLEQDVLMFQVADNGIGFSSAGLAEKKTLGLRGMRERIKLLGGSFDITSVMGMGTTILITVPLNDKQKSHA